jgi:hypothetical protein
MSVNFFGVDDAIFAITGILNILLGIVAYINWMVISYRDRVDHRYSVKSISKSLSGLLISIVYVLSMYNSISNHIDVSTLIIDQILIRFTITTMLYLSLIDSMDRMCKLNILRIKEKKYVGIEY